MKFFHPPKRPLMAYCSSLTLFLVTINAAFGGGVVNTNTDADLRAALVGGGTITFTFDGTIVLTNTLVISSDTIVDGSGHSITISGGGAVRIFRVNSGAGLTLKRLTVADGFIAEAPEGLGGGLFNSGATTIVDCTFSNNVAADMLPFYGIGGAINHDGTKLQITGTTFFRNAAGTAGGAISCGFGTVATGNITITNCTFYENGAGWADHGGAIFMDEPLQNPVTIVNCTFASNTNGAVDHNVTGIWPNASGVRMINSILADTVGSDAVIGITDWGHNLTTDGSVNLTNATSLKNTNPMLGALANNGGPTLTLPLLTGSPAINAADQNFAPPTDQRGQSRPYGSSPDIGAYEWTAFMFHLSVPEFIDGLCRFYVTGSAGAIVRLEASSNLSDWSSISTNMIDSSNLLELLVPVVQDQPNRFFRTVMD